MSFRKLEVWNYALDLVERVYAISQSFPKNEEYGLALQMRKAAVSIPSNIAEGNGRWYSKDYVRFLYMSRGSLMELLTQIEIARRLGYLSKRDYDDLLERIKKIHMMLNRLINSIKQRSPTNKH